MSGRWQLLGLEYISDFQFLLDVCLPNAFCTSEFDEFRWPLEPIATDEADWEVVEHYLNKTGTLRDGLRHLEELAAKDEIRLLTGSRRAMEYMTQHRDAQLDHGVILPLYSRYQTSSGDWDLPIFGCNWGGERLHGLLMHPADETFKSSWSWLVLKRKQK